MSSSNRAPAIKPVNDWVDAVYVISVKGSDFRIRHIEAELAKHGIAFSFMFEHDAVDLDPALLTATFGPSSMRPAHQSLVLKNIQIWKDSVARGYRRVLVFEDDAVLGEDFGAGFSAAMAAAAQLPPGWLVFLGGIDTKVPDSYFLAPGPLVELPIPTAEGCVHDLLAMQRRLAWLESHKVTLPVDHLMCHIDQAVGSPQYWLRHPIVEQGSVTGTFESLLDSGRQKHSRTYNVLRNRWNKFRRRRLREWLVKTKALFC
ncbi:MAG: glycosyltransferase family 25 protein [Bacteroidota bacterium]